MLAAWAKTELSNKRKSHELEQLTRIQQSKAPELTTSSTKLKQKLLHHNDITPGSYVYVAPDLSRGMCSFGGYGFVTAVDGDSILRIFTVQHDKCGSSGRESGICYTRLTVMASPFASAKLVRERRSPYVTNGDTQSPPTARQRTVLSTVDALAYDASHGRKKGWRAIDLGVSKLGSRYERFQSLLCQDTKELVGLLAGQSSAGVSRPDTQQRTRNGQFWKE
jgi:hypothetical protein